MEVCKANVVLIYSPDTDIYNVGLGLLHVCTSKQFSIQLNVLKSAELRYLHFDSALQNDPDLASLLWQRIVPTLQLYLHAPKYKKCMAILFYIH